VIPENIFSVAHTIKGTGSFLGRPWREAPVHFAETFMGNVRDGIRVLATAVVGTTTSLAAQSAAADGSP
jgi:chemotaxis protein histidine kinase CheA